MIVKALVGLVLFVGALVGGLAATGRLNHEGTANIPVLNALFPAPAPADGADPHGADAHDADAHAATGGTAAAVNDGESHAADAAHDAAPQDAEKPRRSKVGRSLVEPEKAAGDGHGGDAHGEAAGDGHGGDAHGADPHGSGAHEQPKAPHGGEQPPPAPGPEGDFAAIDRALESQGKVGYSPGAYFRFDGMPAALTAQELNEAWQRVQGVTQDLERKQQALDLRDQELRELADDISRRWKELGDERLQVEQMQRQLDAKIQQFQQTVRLVRNDEVALLKRNAETMAAFERSKAAELIEQQWTTDKGQDEVLKLFEFMDKDAVNEILAALPTATVQDILKKRLSVSKEAAASARGK